MSSRLLRQIEKALNTEILEHRSLPVGFGLTGLFLSLLDGRQAAVKASQKAHDSALEIEAFMLRELKRHSNLPVPEVYYSGDGLLIMEWLKSGGSINASAQRHAAELLTDLHAKRFDHFGYSRDTLIGPLHQPNTQSDNWVDFFREQRLLHMAGEALSEQRLPHELYERLRGFADNLGDFLNEPPHASLLHGDLWSGNIVANNSRISGFIDPAIYCGHPEIELAFTTMFNSFGKPFFDAYQAISPLEPGFFEQRLDIYNLYPNLVHLRLFGNAYLPPIKQTLAKLGY